MGVARDGDSATTGIGDRIRSRRRERGWTIRELADRAGLSMPYVSNLERGRGNPTLDAITSLAEALEVTVAALVGGAEGDDETKVRDLAADLPISLQEFARSERFESTLSQLAAEHELGVDELRGQVLRAMAVAPRRSSGEPTEQDWQRLWDAYRLILTE